MSEARETEVVLDMAQSDFVQNAVGSPGRLPEHERARIYRRFREHFAAQQDHRMGGIFRAAREILDAWADPKDQAYGRRMDRAVETLLRAFEKGPPAIENDEALGSSYDAGPFPTFPEGLRAVEIPVGRGRAVRLTPEVLQGLVARMEDVTLSNGDAVDASRAARLLGQLTPSGTLEPEQGEAFARAVVAAMPIAERCVESRPCGKCGGPRTMPVGPGWLACEKCVDPRAMTVEQIVEASNGELRAVDGKPGTLVKVTLDGDELAAAMRKSKAAE